MKKFIVISLLLGGNAFCQDNQTFETTERLFANADLNGDGLPDAVVVDRATGTATLGFQFASGSFSWSSGSATGAGPVTSLAVGKLNTVDYYGVTTPTLGRLVFQNAFTTGSQPTVIDVFPKITSPKSMAFFPISSTTLPELLVVGDKGAGLGNRYGYELRPAINGATTPIWEGAFSIETHKIASVRVKAGTPPRVLEYYGNSLYIEGISAAGLSTSPSLPGALTNASTLFAVGNFDGTAMTQFFFYDAGTTTIRTAKITEPSAGTYGWSALSTFSMPQAVKLIVPMPATGGGTRLGFIFADGSVSLYNYTGSGTPSFYRSLTPNGSLPADVLLPAGPDAVIIVRGGGWQNFRTAAADPVGNQFSGTATLGSTAAKVSNVVFLSSEAFAKVDSTVLATGQVREWTTAATGSGASWNITSVVSSGAAGLGGASTVARGAPAATAATLLNQVRSNASIYLADASPGLTVGDLVIAPAAGVYPLGSIAPGLGAPTWWTVGSSYPNTLLYDPAPVGGDLIKIPAYLTVTLQPTRSGDAVWYRVNDSGWSQLPAPGQIELFGSATIDAYSTNGTTRSATRRQVYNFAIPTSLSIQPGTDTDGDGLSDQWEKNFGATNPLADNDADGATNLSEFQAGTDPQNASSVPAPQSELALRLSEQSLSQYKLAWDTALGNVVLETSSSMLSGSWQPITAGIVVNGAETSYTFTLGGRSLRANFYRLRRP